MVLLCAGFLVTGRTYSQGFSAFPFHDLLPFGNAFQVFQLTHMLDFDLAAVAAAPFALSRQQPPAKRVRLAIPHIMWQDIHLKWECVFFARETFVVKDAAFHAAFRLIRHKEVTVSAISFDDLLGLT